jgi:hypothetical protein
MHGVFAVDQFFKFLGGNITAAGHIVLHNLV